MQKTTSLPALKKPSGLIVDFHRDPVTGAPPKEGIYSRKWTTPVKRFLHEHRERQWLLQKAKHGYLDFSDTEREELRRYFEALAGADGRIGQERLENMLISLGLASTRKEVHNIVRKIDTNGNGALDFEEFLEIFRTRADTEIFQVFKAMMEGRLGDRNLNFQTVLSTYRRQLFIGSTGARTLRPVRLPSDKTPPESGSKILQNFATLQRTRYAEVLAKAEGGTPPIDRELLSFDTTGGVPPGGLCMVWRGVTDQYNLAPSRPSSAERSKRTLGTPPSPRTVIEEIVKGTKTKKKNAIGSVNWGTTIVIPAPALEEGTKSGKDGHLD